MRSFPNTIKESPFLMAKQSPIYMPAIILVNPYLAENIGSVSRAMLNFGLSDLRLVAPECDHLSANARTLAVGSVELLENARVYSSLEKAVEDLQLVYATTARTREMTHLSHTPSSAAREAISATRSSLITPGADMQSLIKSAFMFGRERAGLTNTELALATSVIHIEAFEHYSVLNLAQAVNIIGYEIWKRRIEVEQLLSSSSSSGVEVGSANGMPPLPSFSEAGPVLSKKEAERLATIGEMQIFLKRLEEGLAAKNYRLTSRNNNSNSNDRESSSSGSGSGSDVASLEIARELQNRGLQSILNRSQVTEPELQMLHGVLSALLKS